MHALTGGSQSIETSFIHLVSDKAAQAQATGNAQRHQLLAEMQGKLADPAFAADLVSKNMAGRCSSHSTYASETDCGSLLRVSVRVEGLVKVIEDELTEKSDLLQAELERLAVEEAEQQLEELLGQQAAHLGAFTALYDG